MDDFLAPDDREFKRTVRNLCGPGAGGMTSGHLPTAVYSLVSKVPGTPVPEAGPASLPGRKASRSVSREALAVEEIAAFSPSLGRAIAGSRPEIPAGETLPDGPVRTAWSIGTAAFILRNCYSAARERGLFESPLLSYRRVQEDLAAVLAQIEYARIRAYRVFDLIGRGGRDRAEPEMELLLADIRKALHAARTLAAAIIGPGWLAENVPPDDLSIPPGRVPAAGDPERSPS